MMEINGLPEEFLLNVHSLLAPADLKSAVLVDKWWKTVGENPRLWRWCLVTVRKREDIAKFSIRRLCRVQNIKIAKDANLGKAQWELLLQTVEKLPELKNIDGLWNQNLEAVDPKLLARLLIQVENVDLWGLTGLSTEHITCIIQQVLQGTTKLKKLSLKGHDLSAIQTEILTRAVNKLEEVNLHNYDDVSHSHFTKHCSTSQITSILQHVLQDSSKLKKMCLQGHDLSTIETKLLTRAVNKLEEVNLFSTRLSTAQITSILTSVVEDNTNLNMFHLWFNDYSAVEKNLLARAVSKQEEVFLYHTKLSTSQITSIFTHIAEDNMKLKKLYLTRNDLSAVEKEILSTALNKLEEVDLSNNELSTPQITSILTNIMELDSKLKKLNLEKCQLSAIEEEMLARAVNKLHEVNLCGTKLSNSQITRILIHAVQQDSKLKKLNLTQNNMTTVEGEVLARALKRLENLDLDVHHWPMVPQVSSILTYIMEDKSKLKKIFEIKGINLSAVKEEVLVQAVNRLEEVDLCHIYAHPRLSILQITDILTHIMEQDSKLKKISLWRNDLSAIEKEVLARAVNKLEDVNLKDTKLTTPQIIGILNTVTEKDNKLKKLNLSLNDLSAVEKEFIAIAVSKLEEVNLCSTKLSTQQITNIFTHIMEHESKLKKLKLGFNDVSAIEKEVLAQGLSKLEEVDLENTNIRAAQMNHILTKAVELDSELRIFGLLNREMSAIDKEVLARAKSLVCYGSSSTSNF